MPRWSVDILCKRAEHEMAQMTFEDCQRPLKKFEGALGFAGIAARICHFQNELPLSLDDLLAVEDVLASKSGSVSSHWGVYVLLDFPNCSSARRAKWLYSLVILSMRALESGSRISSAKVRISSARFRQCSGSLIDFGRSHLHADRSNEFYPASDQGCFNGGERGFPCAMSAVFKSLDSASRYAGLA
jgi:hypothetical protein